MTKKRIASSAINVPIILEGWLEIDAKINSGHYGIVSRGTLRREDRETVPVAIKKTKQRTDDPMKEAQRLIAAKHSNVVEVFGLCILTSEPYPVLVMECLAGDLQQELIRISDLKKSEKRQKYVSDLQRILLDVANAMAHLEAKGFVHRDLAARNVLLTHQKVKKAVAKLGDFGLARDTYEKPYYMMRNNWPLPIPWCAPEILPTRFKRLRDVLLDFAGIKRYENYAIMLATGKHSSKSDVWAFGVLMWETVTFGRRPYEGIQTDIIQYVVTERKTLAIPEHQFSENLNELMKKTWRFEQHERPSFAEIIETLHSIQLLKKRTSGGSIAEGTTKTTAGMDEGKQVKKVQQGKYENTTPRHDLLHDAYPEQSSAQSYGLAIPKSRSWLNFSYKAQKEPQQGIYVKKSTTVSYEVRQIGANGEQIISTSVEQKQETCSIIQRSSNPIVVPGNLDQQLQLIGAKNETNSSDPNVIITEVPEEASARGGRRLNLFKRRQKRNKHNRSIKFFKRSKKSSKTDSTTNESSAKSTCSKKKLKNSELRVPEDEDDMKVSCYGGKQNKDKTIISEKKESKEKTKSGSSENQPDQIKAKNDSSKKILGIIPKRPARSQSKE